MLQVSVYKPGNETGKKPGNLTNFPVWISRFFFKPGNTETLLQVNNQEGSDHYPIDGTNDAYELHTNNILLWACLWAPLRIKSPS